MLYLITHFNITCLTYFPFLLLEINLDRRITVSEQEVSIIRITEHDDKEQANSHDLSPLCHWIGTEFVTGGFMVPPPTELVETVLTASIVCTKNEEFVGAVMVYFSCGKQLYKHSMSVCHTSQGNIS